MILLVFVNLFVEGDAIYCFVDMLSEIISHDLFRNAFLKKSCRGQKWRIIILFLGCP